MVETMSGQQYYPGKQSPGIIEVTEVQRAGNGARPSFSPWARMKSIALRWTNAVANECGGLTGWSAPRPALGMSAWRVL